MFETRGQLYFFISCFAIGVILGIFYVFLIIIKGKIKHNWIKIVIDILFYIIASLIFTIYTKINNFPTVRLYMPTAVLLGLLCSVKSFNIILAKLLKKLYNNFNKKLRKNYERR